MSYQVLARKWRPKSFDTLVGQDHVVRALTQALTTGRLHHAYLFTGTRGVGKTTLSRILAKALNCIGQDGQGGITPTPCGVCRPCLEIDAGRFVDYIEMDAASNRGVEEMASLLEQAVYAPSNARFKVYMIDEVHMLTNHAFNAMLKTLEEPPEYVKFILATTDPQKIPVTVLSRCLQFNLKQMPPAQVESHLAKILDAEQVPYEGGALRLLGRAAQGSMRDGLSLTDQAIAYSGGVVSEATVAAMLGALDQTYLTRILEALAHRDGAALFAVADEIVQRSLSFDSALADLASLLLRVGLYQQVPEAAAEEPAELERLALLAAQFDAEEIQLQYEIALKGRAQLELAPDAESGFRMTLLRMLAFRPTDVAESQPKSQGDASRAGNARTGAQRQLAESMPTSITRAAPLEQGPGAASSPLTSSSDRVSNEASPRAQASDVSAQSGRFSDPPAERSLPSGSSPRGPRDALEAARQAMAARSPQRREPASGQRERVSEARSTAPAGLEPPLAGNRESSRPVARSLDVEPAPDEPEPAPSSDEGAPLTGSTWLGIARELPVGGLARQLAEHAQFASMRGSEVTLRVATRSLAERPVVDKVEQALSAALGQAIKVKVDVAAVTGATLAAIKGEERADRQARAEAAIAADPFVVRLLQDFDATLIPGSVRPINQETPNPSES